MNPKRKFFLFNQSKNFCAVPWNHFQLWFNGDIRTCGKGSNVSFGNINQESLEQILNNKEFVSIRQDLSTDQRNSNCDGCHYLTTESEHFDLRNHYNPMFKNLDIDYDDLHSFKLHGIDLHWDNTCNFKCVYCHAEQSSAIAQEQGTATNRSDVNNIDKIIDLIVSNQYQIKEIYFSGGEPLLVKYNAKLLSKIDNTDLPIRVNSNISHAHDHNPVMIQLKRFKNVLWTVSAESSGAQFEYSRTNAKWDEFLQRLTYIKQHFAQIRLNSVFFVGSAVTVFDTIEYFTTHYNITDITINQLNGHPDLHVRNCPDSVKQQSRDSLHKLLNSNLIAYRSNSYYNIARCEKELDKEATNPHGYQQYFDQLDQLRKTNWRTVFPELIK